MGKWHTSAGAGRTCFSNVVAKSKNCIDVGARFLLVLRGLHNSLSAESCYWTGPFLKVPLSASLIPSPAPGLVFLCSTLSESIFTSNALKPYRLAWNEKNSANMLGGSLLLVGLTPSHNKSSKYLNNKYPERNVALIQYLNIIYIMSKPGL